MAGNTYKWLGGSNNNDAATLANWQVFQSGSFGAAGALPGTLDTITLDNGGLLNDSSGDLPLVGVTFAIAGSGGTLAVGNTTLDRQNGIGGLNVAAGTTGTLLSTGTVTDGWDSVVSGSGATLDVRVASGTLDLQSALFAQQGGVVNVGTSVGATFLSNGGLVAYGGTVDVAPVVLGNGILVVGGGGTMALQAGVQPGENIAFIDNAGSLVLQQAGTFGSGIFGFQAGDRIDLTALNAATLKPITVSGNFTTLTDGTSTVVLPLSNEGFTAGSFQTTSDAGGHVLLTTTLVNADWLGGANGDWATGTAWSTGTAPSAGSNVVIGDLGNTFKVTATNAAAQSLLMLAPSGTLALSGTFAVGKGILDPVGVIAVQAGATVTAAVFAELINGGTLTMATGSQMTLSGGISNAVAGIVAAEIAAQATLDGATLDAAAGSVMIGLATSGDSTLDAINGAVATVYSTGVGGRGTSTGTLMIDHAHWTDNGSGTATPFAGDMVVGGLIGSNNGSGQLILQNAATLTDQNAIIAANAGATGFATIQDAALWSIANNLSVGANGGYAQLQVWNGPSNLGGGSISVGNTLQLDGGMSVDGGGHVTAQNLAISNGTLQIDPASTVAIGSGGAGGLGGLVITANSTASLNNGRIEGNVVDLGTMTFAGVNTLDSGSISGTGTVNLAGNATLAISDNGSLNNVGFLGNGAMLSLLGNTAVNGTIGGFGPGNTIDLPGVTFNAAMPVSFDPTTHVLTLGGGNSFAVQAQFTLDAGTIISPATAMDAQGGTEILACYAEGTRIATPHGAVPVEALRVGKDVLALEGGRWVARPVRWIGRSTVRLAGHPQAERAAPVRLHAHAIASEMPAHDLLLSPEHAVFLDGVLVQAQALLNGATVTQEFPDRVAYWHVELDRHSLLCAEGLPAESYLDTGNRAAFAGEQGVRALHPVFASGAAWAERACAELVLQGPRLAAIQARLRARAEALGGALTPEAGLTVLADGIALVPDARGRVRLPAGTRALRLVSRSFVPHWLGINEDRRRLGVAVASLRLAGRRLPARAFGAGWHAAEPGWRWTDGDAALLLAPLPRATTLTVRTAAAGGRYWLPAPPIAARAGRGSVRAAASPGT